jgi:transcription-repair coupling factor (superfamily II helicase)
VTTTMLPKLEKQLNNAPRHCGWNYLDSSGRKAFLEIYLAHHSEGQYLILCPADRRVNELVDHLRHVTDMPVLPLFEDSPLPVEVLAKDDKAAGETCAMLDLLQRGKPLVICANAMAVFNVLPNADYFRNGIVELKTGDIIEPEKLVETLYEIGYQEAGICDQPGLYALRGGILDVFSPGADSPVRIEWFDDEIDSLRSFSPETQKSTGVERSIRLLPAQHLFFTNSERQTINNAVSEELAQLKDRRSREDLQALQGHIKNMASEEAADSLLHYYAYKSDHFHASVFDYLSPDAAIIIDGSESCQASLVQKDRDIREQLRGLFAMNDILPSRIEYQPDIKQIQDRAKDQRSVVLSELEAPVELFGVDQQFHYGLAANPLKAYPIDRFIKDINKQVKNGWRLVFYHDNEEVRKLIENLLNEYALPYAATDGIEPLPAGSIAVLNKRLYFEEAFEEDHTIFMNANIFKVDGSEKAKRPTSSKKRHDSLLIEDLSVGDYIVHENYGIGIYLGIEHIRTNAAEKDYLIIQYKGADKLFVPLDQLHLVEKYSAGENRKPKINKLGGVEWTKSKAKVKKSLEDMSEELLEMHAKRQTRPGFAFAPDDDLQREFEATFPYVETPDQLKAINDVKRDMERPRVMDRLICGDVGFGKTEVAMRAAFKAVCSHKQVAVLVPTTILALQHFESFSARMKDFGVEIALLTRFNTVKEQNKIFRDIHAHKIDIVIGTHKLLNNKLVFASLGLLIIDEEQRFGVKQKERLKSLQENVDVLTMSATPIPRTLYFSLTGIRDMSLIETPPDNRLPIQTYVIEEMPMIIEQAVRRELLRGGQVFVVYNSIAGLNELAEKYRDLFPQAQIVIGHGRMKEAELEDVILRFQRGEAQILISTTIIETGIDMPNVNTMIVHDADHFGLAQLYQLKGRVGRSKNVAYAYLMYRRDKILSEDAKARLKTLRDNTALGSGYKISMRDLEIRGSGNLLGQEQSGHVAEIGFALYLKMLDETVRKLKHAVDEPVEVKKASCEIDINLSAFIPEEYISDTRLRIGIYQRIDKLSTAGQRQAMFDELKDRFGTPPTSVYHLLRISELKSLAEDAGIAEIKQKNASLYIRFDTAADIDIQKLIILVTGSKSKMHIKNIADETYLIYQIGREKLSDRDIDVIKRLLKNLAKVSDPAQ